jgi:MFS family permease
VIPSELRALEPYMRYWSARVLGVAASQMLMVAIGWQLYELTGSAWDLGLVGLLQFAPSLALVLVAGHAVDRFHRGRIVAACMAAQVGVALLLLGGPWIDARLGISQRALILTLAVALGAIKAFQMPAGAAIVPLLVPAALMPRALAFGSAGLQAAIIGGPALGGVIFVGGAGAVYATCAAMFAAAALLVARVRHASPAAAEPVSWDSLLAGVRYVRAHPVLLGAISLDLFAVLLGGATALLPMFARDILQVGPWGLGLLRGAPAAGALLMSIALVRWPVRRRAGVRLLGAVAAYGVTMIVFALSTSFWLSLAALAASGAADMVSVVVRQTMVQLETPDAMRGRVSAVSSLFIGGSNQLGEFESGATAALFGPVGSVLLGGIGAIVVTALWWRWFPALARRDRLVDG